MITSNVIQTHFFVEQFNDAETTEIFYELPRRVLWLCLLHLHSNMPSSLNEDGAICHMFTVTNAF